MNAQTDSSYNSNNANNEDIVIAGECKEIKKRRLKILVDRLDGCKGKTFDSGVPNDEEKRLKKSLETLHKTVADLYKKVKDNKDEVNSTSEKTISDSLNLFESKARETCTNTADPSAQPAIKKWIDDVLLLKYMYSSTSSSTTSINAITGLALSGGGIRSAAFNLGVLQALDKFKLFKRVDYLSTVSGGGYIGASLTWFLQRQVKKEFPFSLDGGEKLVGSIRRHASYLTPGDGLNLAALLAAVARGIFVNLVVLIPPFIIILWLITFGGLKVDWLESGLLKSNWIIILTLTLSAITIWIFRSFRDTYNPEGWVYRTINKGHNTTSFSKADTSGSQECSDIFKFVIRILLWIAMLTAVYNLFPTVKDFSENSDDSYHFFLILPLVGALVAIGASTFLDNSTFLDKEGLFKFLAKLDKEGLFKCLAKEIIEITSWLIVFWIIFLTVAALWPILIIALMDSEQNFQFIFPPELKAALMDSKQNDQVIYPPVVFFSLLLAGLIYLAKLLVNYLLYALLSTSKARLTFEDGRFYRNYILYTGKYCGIILLS